MILPLDTSAEALEMQRAVYRRLGGAERVSIAFRLTTMVREATVAGIRHRHPDYSDIEARAALHRLILGDELMTRVFPTEELVDP